ncbi:DedA family protein/thiosulfate sulfurtransferase GlpE [Thermithiobacillus tepidarius DSM 3134]|uniref:DedA family protein/thiosulfate sulfurtransferase GlpE n=1 Tax=Thermithiobacillus tepidarius TaxID=929 RepID=UPI0004129328|nr:DedA family protein/thiosulfate sulfurtransferase GlpE [Thermithiobacillus tepidarius]
MQALYELIIHYGLALVFANVLLTQLGLPLPAIPTLIVTGALAAAGQLFAPAVFAVALTAAVLADCFWFAAGRRYGYHVLRLLCRISLSPDSCVRQTENTFERWGTGTIVIAKFIPGLATIAPPLAGALRVRPTAFLLFDGLGSALWVGAGIGAGLVLHAQIDEAAEYLATLGTVALDLLGALLFAFIGIKWWQRRRFYETLRMARISVDELQRLLQQGAEPVILDVRSAGARKLDPRRIPGALAVDPAALDDALAQLSPAREVVLYCTCPNEASAARVARALMDRGIQRVRPLAGGLDAWFNAGLAGEEGRSETSDLALAPPGNDLA